MPKISYLTADGRQFDVNAEAGSSIMQAAVMSGLPGINADCGGACQCATCHVYVEEPWASLMPPMDDMEDAMLDSTAEPRRAESRLSCRLTVAESDLIVRLPAAQV